MIFDMLRTTNSSIELIELGWNQKIDDHCVKSLGEYIISNKNIKGISLGFNTISDAGIEVLAPYFDDNSTLKRLSIDGNKRITNKSIPTLVKMIESSHIESLGFDSIPNAPNNILVVALSCNWIKNGANQLILYGR